MSPRLLCFCLCLASLAMANEPGSFLHDSKNVHNAEHIKQHMGEYFEEGEDMNEKLKLDDKEAMEFHYFKLHDYDNNNKLDGHELGIAMTHFHEESSDGDEGKTQTSYSVTDDELGSLIEMILKEDDLNDDGYVDYYEFVQASRRGSETADDKDKDNL